MKQNDEINSLCKFAPTRQSIQKNSPLLLIPKLVLPLIQFMDINFYFCGLKK